MTNLPDSSIIVSKIKALRPPIDILAMLVHLGAWMTGVMQDVDTDPRIQCSSLDSPCFP
jgi:hypothetical protein